MGGLFSHPLSELSRTLDDPGPRAGFAALDFPGLLVRSEPERDRLHQKGGRAGNWHGFFAGNGPSRTWADGPFQRAIGDAASVGWVA